MSNVTTLLESIDVLNIDKNKSTIRTPFLQLLTQEQKIDNESFIISDADEELLILVAFTQPINLKSMKIYYSPHNDDTTSGPKDIHIYKTKNLNVNFDDIEYMTPNKIFECKSKKLPKGHKIKLQSKQFIKTQKLIIHIISNQNSTDTTSVNAISFTSTTDIQKKKEMIFQKIDVECTQCSRKDFRGNMNSIDKKQMIKPITQHTLDTDDKNTHCFIWSFASESEIAQFNYADVNDIPFRSDYHIIDEYVFYFELTPNGTTDRIHVGAGKTNVWLNLHQSINCKDFVKLRFQCFCINNNMSFIGEKDAILNPQTQQQKEDCRGIRKVTAAISTDNSMQFSKLKHLKQFSFLCKVTINPKQFQCSQEELKNDAADYEKKECWLCDAGIEQCGYVTEVKRIMLCKDEMKSTFDYALPKLVNLFHHLLLEHDKQNEFEYIMRQIAQTCEVGNCVRLRRNYRIRDNKDNMSRITLMNSHDSAKQQILDKIHCYFVHSIDIGHRLSSQQQQELENISKENTENKYDNDDVNAEDFRNHKLKKLQQFQSQQITNNNLPSFTRRYGKYKQLNPQSIANKVESDSYSYGQLFFYLSNQYGFVNVLPKFESFKAEMLQNALCKMRINQFDSMYIKAMAHFDSDYRKNQYKDMVLEHILASMTYCNFGDIQYEFSKTFRGNDICRHNQFYYFGFYLYVAVNKYGENTASGHTLYHGVNNKLTFPDVVGPSLGIKMNSPLSTSTSLSVACNFAGTTGLLVELGGPQVTQQGLETKHFDMVWLSDYANESECLLIGTSAGLYIKNITSVDNAMQYALTIGSLCIMQEKIKAGGTGIYLRWVETKTLKKLLACIVEHQLSKKFPNNINYQRMLNQLSKKSFPTIDTYAQSLIDAYCKGRDIICIRCSDKSKSMSYFARYFYPNVKAIPAMFCNVKDIVLLGVDKNDMINVLDSILDIWGNNNINGRLEIVRIYPDEKSLNNGQKIEDYVNSIIFLNVEGFSQHKHIMKSYDKNKAIILLLHSNIIEPDPINWECISHVNKQFTEKHH